MVRRRRFLRTLGAATTGGVLAGCQDGENEKSAPGEDSDNEDSAPRRDDENGEEPLPGEVPDRVAFPDLSAREPTYHEWIPGRTDLEMDWVTAINFAQLREQKQRLSASAYEELASWVARGDYFGVPFEDIDGQIIAHRELLVIHLGEFGRSRVRETLTSSGYEERANRGSVTFYLDDDRDKLFAVGEQGAIERTSRVSESFVESAMALFETAAGERTRRYRAAEPFRLFVDEVGWPLSATIPRKWTELDFPSGFETVIPTEARADLYYGSGRHVADGALVTRHWFSIPADEGSAQLLRSAFEDAPLRIIDEQQVAVRETTSGVEVAALAPFESTGGGTDPIQVTLTASLDDGTLVLDHRAGDPIPPDRLRVRWGGGEYSPSESIEPGDSHRVEGRDFSDTVTVMYTRPNGETLALLAQADAG